VSLNSRNSDITSIVEVHAVASSVASLVVRRSGHRRLALPTSMCNAVGWIQHGTALHKCQRVEVDPLQKNSEVGSGRGALNRGKKKPESPNE